MATAPRREWDPIIAEAVAIVNSYDTPVTLRQLFYRLVARALLTNDRSAYSTLSALTAAARRAKTFPALLDATRTIDRQPAWTSPKQFMRLVVPQYQRDHTEGQEVLVVIGAEKATLKAQFEMWFEALHIPVVVLKGYSSESYETEVRDMVLDDGRPAVLLYAGDFDASGEDITRNFVKNTDCWKHVERICLNADQVIPMGLTIGRGKPQDSRANAFRDRHAHLFGHMFAGEYVTTKAGVRLPQQGIVQVEVEAIDPPDLRAMLQSAVDDWWDYDISRQVVEQEAEEKAELRERYL